MSRSDNFTNALIAANNKAAVANVISEMVPFFCGYKISEVQFAGTMLIIIGVVRDSDTLEDENVIILQSELTTGKDLIGRKSYCGITPVDLEIIRNIAGC